ncbi:MAG: Gfo/Idh/MocA family oxidoreductase [bacterium]|nr:Gfo/Idh/MocA family oxidoreductase [bacterium]
MGINIGAIGCGYWGPNLIRNFDALPDSNLFMCSDLDQRRLDYILSLYPHTKVTKDYKQILHHPKVDAVVITTPARTHFTLAKEALLEGKHVFVEKPLSLTTKECEELISLSEKKGKILMVGHLLIYHPAVRKIKGFIDQGELGDIYYIYTTRVNLGRVKTDVNALWNFGPHDISVILYWLDAFPISVSAVGESYLQDKIEDVVFITLRFENKVIASLHISWLDPGKVRRITVVGSKKMVVYDDVNTEEKVKVYDKGVVMNKSFDNFGEATMTLRFGDIYSPRIDTKEPLKVECQHFLDCILNNQSPLTNGYEGMKVVKILEKASISLKEGGKVIDIE